MNQARLPPHKHETPQMQTYPVEIDPEQVVRWVVAENRIAPHSLRVGAWLTAETREIPVRREFHLGDEEREDLSETATIATLEIAPVHADEGWTLKVIVEDEAGPRMTETETAIGGEQKIDPGVFYKEFIRSERGIASVVAEVEGPAAEAHISRLVHAIETDRHAQGQGRPKH